MSRIHLGIYLGAGSPKIGPGKVQLLEAIREQGSISGAARSMGMAYRHAWVLVDELNRCFDEPVVAAAAGGREGGGARLTAWGEEVVRRFGRMQESACRAVETDLAALDAKLVPGESGRSR